MAKTSVKNGSASSAEEAQEKAKQVANQAQEQVEKVADKARGPLVHQVDQGTTKLGERVKSNAKDVRSAARALHDQGNDAPARLAEQAADRVDEVGAWLSNSDGDKILHDVEDFSRKNPWAVAAAALAVGFLASRALKASSHQRYAVGAGAARAGAQ